MKNLNDKNLLEINGGDWSANADSFIVGAGSVAGGVAFLMTGPVGVGGALIAAGAINEGVTLGAVSVANTFID